MGQKVAFTKRLAEFQAQVSSYGDPDTASRRIGTLNADFVEKEKSAIGMPKTFAPGQVIFHEFFMGDRLRCNVPRGPFRSSHDWLSSGFRILILEQTAALEREEDGDNRKDAEEHLHAAQGLLSILPKVLPGSRIARR